MVVGYNHNFRYKGAVYHVQTEDGGLRSPSIVTLLYHQGTILASKKTSYADIARIENLSRVVEELMKEQHREMLRRLKNGELDEQIQARLGKDNSHSPEPPKEIFEEGSQGSSAKEPVVPDPDLDTFLLSYLLGDGDR